MSTRWLIVSVSVTALFASAGSAEAQYRHGRGYGGYGYGGFGGGYGAGSTVAGSFLAGAAMYTGALGQFNNLTSQAAINYQQAYSMALDNRLKYEQTYFQMRRENISYRAEMAAMRPHATPEQLVEFNRARIPGRLSPAEWDPGRGVFGWPQNLMDSFFAGDRVQVENLFAARDADPHAAGLGSENYRQLKRQLMMMSDDLHSVLRQMSPDEYIAASKFLKSLEYEARFAPGV